MQFKKLTHRNQAFIEAYIRTWNATQAAREAGYSPHTDYSIGQRLLKHPLIQQAIQDRLRAVASETNQNAELLLQDYEQRRTVNREAKARARGCVYIIKSDNGLFKIGKAVNFERRLRTLNSIIPNDLEIVRTFESQQISTLEASLHTAFAHKRVKGEWFRLDNSDLDIADSIANGI